MNKIFLPFLVVVLSINRAIAEGVDWTPSGKSNLATVYDEKYGIEQLSGDVIRALVKNVYPSEGVKEFGEAFPRVDRSETISYTLYANR